MEVNKNSRIYLCKLLRGNTFRDCRWFLNDIHCRQVSYWLRPFPADGCRWCRFSNRAKIGPSSLSMKTQSKRADKRVATFSFSYVIFSRREMSRAQGKEACWWRDFTEGQIQLGFRLLSFACVLWARTEGPSALCRKEMLRRDHLPFLNQRRYADRRASTKVCVIQRRLLFHFSLSLHRRHLFCHVWCPKKNCWFPYSFLCQYFLDGGKWIFTIVTINEIIYSLVMAFLFFLIHLYKCPR